MKKNPEAVPANQAQNQGQDKKVLSKAEKMNLLFKDLKDTAIQSEKDDILGKMLSLMLGDKKSKSGEGDVDGNSLKTREEKGANSDDEQKMMMMALALIFGAMAIALTGGAAGAAIIGGAPAIGAIPDIMKLGSDFLGKKDSELQEEESRKFGKSFLAFLLSDKVKDNILGVGDSFLNGDNNFVKSIGKYIESLRGMGDEDKKKEIDSLKTMVKGSVALLEGKGADKSDEKTGPNSNEADQKFNAIFAQFEAMISKPKEDLEESKNLKSILREIQVGNAIVSIESTTTKQSVALGGDVPSTASLARRDGDPRAESAVSPGRAAPTAPAPGGR
jgi:hypothetical protein